MKNKLTAISVFMVLFLMGTTVVFAQKATLKARIVDEKKNPKDLIRATLFKNDSILVQQTLTDGMGLFSISAEKGYYKLLLEQFGKELLKKEFSLMQDTDLGEIIIDESITLEGVSISGQKKIIERKYDKLIFNVDQSPLKQGFSGLEVLKRSPGLNMNSKGDIVLRNESVLIMINGRKMNFSPEELTNYLNSLNSENIKSIEIQALGSAETEASNSGGVVNIVLSKIPLGYRSTLRTSYTFRDKDHSDYFGGLSNQFGSEKWNVYNKLNYSNSHNLAKFNSNTNFHTAQGSNINDGQSDFRIKNFNITTGTVFYPAKNHEIGAEVYYSNTFVGRDGWEDLLVFNPELNSISRNSTLFDNKNDFWNTTLNYTFKLDDNGSRIRFIGDVGNNAINNTNEVDTRYSFGSLPDNYNQFLSDAKSTFVNVQVDYLQKIKDNWELNAGAKSARVSRNNSLNVFLFDNGWVPSNGGQHFDNGESVLANYATIAKQWKEKHSLKLGLRTEYTLIRGIDFINNTNVEREYFDWFPSVYYGYTVKQGQTVSISYARRITRPSFRDLNPFVIKQNDFLFQQGNPDLQPEYTNKLDFTYSIGSHSFSLFGSFSDDLIAGVYSATGNVTYYKPQNFGKSRSVGLDYSYHTDINKWLYGNVSAGVLNYNFETGETKHGRVSFYNTIYTRFKFSQSLFLDLFNNFFSKNQFFVTKAATQYNLDVSLQKNIWKDVGIFKVSCSDVFNTQRDRNVSYYNNFNFGFYQKSITRAFSLSFTYTFKNQGKVEQKNVQSENSNKGRL